MLYIFVATMHSGIVILLLKIKKFYFAAISLIKSWNILIIKAQNTEIITHFSFCHCHVDNVSSKAQMYSL